MVTHLDAFREAYTLNWTGEKATKGMLAAKHAKELNKMKVLAWFPIIGQIIAITALVDFFRTIKTNQKKPDFQENKKIIIAYVSRNFIASTGVLNPALFFVDTVGTVVKVCADKLNKK